jgi:hypothetical protein
VEVRAVGERVWLVLLVQQAHLLLAAEAAEAAEEMAQVLAVLGAQEGFQVVVEAVVVAEQQQAELVALVRLVV